MSTSPVGRGIAAAAVPATGPDVGTSQRSAFGAELEGVEAGVDPCQACNEPVNGGGERGGVVPRIRVAIRSRKEGGGVGVGQSGSVGGLHLNQFSETTRACPGNLPRLTTTEVGVRLGSACRSPLALPWPSAVQMYPRRRPAAGRWGVALVRRPACTLQRGMGGE